MVKYNSFIENISTDISENFIIYGINNSGKTFLQKEIIKNICKKNIEKFLFSNIENENKEMIFPHYISVDRIGQSEAEFVNKDVSMAITSEYFDSVIKRIDSGNTILDYKSARQRIEDTNKTSDVEKLLKSVFKNEGTYKFEKYNEYSDGIKNVINIVSLIKYIEEYTTSSPLKIKVLILIDEIELYLHITSQVRFVNSLLDTFPNFNFIFTSHSPVLMQRIDNCKIYLLSDDHNSLELKESQFFFSCDEIMDKSFGLSKYPDQFLDFMNYLNECKKNPNVFTLDMYQKLLESCRLKNYDYNILLNKIILSFIEEMSFRLNEGKIKKGSELYNAIRS